MKRWHVGVAEPRREGLVEWALKVSGIDVYVPRQWRFERLIRGGVGWVETLTIAPYFYAEFDGADLEAYARIKKVRGVRHFLESDEHVPGAVAAEVIEAGRQQELLSRAGGGERRRQGRSDLVLGRRYRIAPKAPWREQIGTLITVHNGRALLDVGHCLLETEDGALVPADPS